MARDTAKRTFDADNLAALEAWAAPALGATDVAFAAAERLAGGAIGENWRLQAHVADGPRQGTHDWVLRTDAPARLAASHDRAHEFACLEVAYGSGVTVPEPIALCEDADVVGAPFMLVAFALGTAQARKIVRDPDLASFGAGLAERLGTELAKIHAITPPEPRLAFLDVPEGAPAVDRIDGLRRHLDAVSEPRPALEYVLNWLEDNAPPAGPLALCHGDYRTGNYLVADGALTGILDWEFCHWGDIHEDLGWFCARCWRFGADDREAGGIAAREAFYRGYRAAAQTPFDETVIAYWEIMAAARWAVVALLQGERHRSGEEPSLELALTARLAPEMEYDALTEIAAYESDRKDAAPS